MKPLENPGRMLDIFAEGGLAHHEQSETVQLPDGRWVNIYGRGTPQAGQRLPGDGDYRSVDEAVEAARQRSRRAPPQTWGGVRAAGGGAASKLYHVTLSKYLDQIRKEGLVPMRSPTNWVKQGDKSRYGSGEIYASDHPEDAARWAARMDWENNKKYGSGNISILGLNRNPKDAWDIDESDPLSQMGNKGRWLKRNGIVVPEYLDKDIPFTADLLKGWKGFAGGGLMKKLFQQGSEPGWLRAYHGGAHDIPSFGPRSEPSPWEKKFQEVVGRPPSGHEDRLFWASPDSKYASNFAEQHLVGNPFGFTPRMYPIDVDESKILDPTSSEYARIAREIPMLQEKLQRGAFMPDYLDLRSIVKYLKEKAPGYKGMMVREDPVSRDYEDPATYSLGLWDHGAARSAITKKAGGGLMQKLKGLPLARRFDELTRYPLEDTTGKNAFVMEMASEASPLKYIGGLPDMGRGGGRGMNIRDPNRLAFMSYDSQRPDATGKSAVTVGKNVMLVDHNKKGKVIPSALIDIEIEKALRGEGYGRETLATLLSNMRDEKGRFPLYDVQPKAKKIWEAMGAEMANPDQPFRAKQKIFYNDEGRMDRNRPMLERNNDYYITPEGFLSSFKRGGLAQMADGGLMKLLRSLQPSARRRLEQAADLVPNLERTYNPEALRSVLNQNEAAFGVIDPADFEKLAYPLHPRNISAPGGATDENIKHLRGLLQEGIPFADIPSLRVGQSKFHEDPTIAISGHEGRHRSRAMSSLGRDRSLVTLPPSIASKTPLITSNDVRSLFDRIQNIEPEGVSRDIAPWRSLFKEAPFKRGGPVKMAGGGLSQIARMLKNEQIGKGDAKRLERAFDQAPKMHNFYSDDALWRMFGEQTPLAVYDPATFRKAAMRLNPMEHKWRLGDEKPVTSSQHVHDLAKLMEKGTPMSDVPFLSLTDDTPSDAMIKAVGKDSVFARATLDEPIAVTGHEGRHRNRAMDLQGIERALMRLYVPEARLPPNTQIPWPPKTERRLDWVEPRRDKGVRGESGMSVGPLQGGLAYDIFKRGGKV